MKVTNMKLNQILCAPFFTVAIIFLYIAYHLGSDEHDNFEDFADKMFAKNPLIKD